MGKNLDAAKKRWKRWRNRTSAEWIKTKNDFQQMRNAHREWMALPPLPWLFPPVIQYTEEELEAMLE